LEVKHEYNYDSIDIKDIIENKKWEICKELEKEERGSDLIRTKGWSGVFHDENLYMIGLNKMLDMSKEYSD